MSPVEATQVCRLFQNVNENKTSLDIPNKLIKIASEPLSLPFTYIYNQSIANGIVPVCSKYQELPQFISQVRSLILGTTDLLPHFHFLAKCWSD